MFLTRSQWNLSKNTKIRQKRTIFWPNFTIKLTKTLNSGEKDVFVFLQKWAYFIIKNAANKLKHNGPVI